MSKGKAFCEYLAKTVVLSRELKHLLEKHMMSAQMATASNRAVILSVCKIPLLSLCQSTQKCLAKTTLMGLPIVIKEQEEIEKPFRELMFKGM